MKVIKRDGRSEPVSFDKVLERVRKAAKGLSVNPDALAQQVLSQIYDGVKTSELDELTAQLAASLSTLHPDWGTLAARICVSNHHKNTRSSFTEVVQLLAHQTMPATGEKTSLVSDDLLAVIQSHGDKIDRYIHYDRDYNFDYFGFKTLEKSYLLRDTHMRVVERPQHMWMRVALGLWWSMTDDERHMGSATATKLGLDSETRLARAFETYDLMSQKFLTHATPTLFNAGLPRQQLSSCFLLAMSDDSISGIYKTLADCAAISKYSGGIGLHIHNIRARGSLIKGTNGQSNGIVPMLRVFNNTARYVDQCFVAGTKIPLWSDAISPQAFSANIEDIQVGNYVMTSGCKEEVDETGKHYVAFQESEYGLRTYKPTPRKVTKKVEHLYTGTLYHLTFDTHVTVSVTPHHPFLTKLPTGEYDYVEVEKLRKGSILACMDGFEGVSILEYISTESVENKKLYDLEIEETHDYAVEGAGFAHNGGGRRNGSFAVYLEPWHADVEDFLKMKLPTGAEEERARDLFYALWIPDLFMERVEADGDWTLFCPNEAPGLADVWGDKFKELYERYEREGRGRRTVKAQKLWFQILDAQMESGTPYLLYKDAANRKSNQQNLGTIKSSNLCTEIVEYSDANETAVCNLASLALPSFVSSSSFGGYDFEALRKATRVAIRNLNRVIDINFYPTPETRRSNMRHRPVGLGVQGLADVFALLSLPWESDDAAKLNQRIFEHMYYAAVEASADLAAEQGSYETFQGSPASQGKLQPDLWGTTPLTEQDGSLDWTTLRRKAAAGLRNSLLIAPMPTASTSQILGFNECFEPVTSNIYTRRTLAGEFIVINKYLVRDLMKRGLWSEDLKQQIVARNGSVQGMAAIPEDLQALYKTAWEIKQRCLIDMAAARGAFICQSQSLNLFVADPNYGKLSSMHMYSWKQGLKTGCYYLRTKAPVTAQKFTVDPRLLAAAQKTAEESKLSGITGTEDDDDVWSSDSDGDEEEKTVTPELQKAAERRALMDRLAAEYEAEIALLKAAKERGEEVCEMCSS